MDDNDALGPTPVGNWPQPVTWGGLEILIVLWLWIFVWPRVAGDVLSATGFYSYYYGADAAALLDADSAAQLRIQSALALFTGPGIAQVFVSQTRQRLVYRVGNWVYALAFPFQLASVPLVLYWASGTRPWQLGLTTRRLGRNLLAGLILACMLTPPVLGINFVVDWIYERTLPDLVQQHPLTLVAQESLWPAEVPLLVFVAIVAAPVMEELVFRGMLQPWFATRPWGPSVAILASLGLASAACAGAVGRAFPQGIGAVLLAAQPALFVVALLPAYGLLRLRSPGGVTPGLFGTALVFATWHSAVWPTPIALLVLAWGLGMLAYRTQSLAGTMVLHGLFNGVSCLVLFLGPR